MCVRTLGHVLLFAIPWILARQAPLSMGLSWQEHWSGLPFPSSGDIPHPGIKPMSPVFAGGFFISAAPRGTEIPNSSSRYSVSLKGGGDRLRLF